MTDLLAIKDQLDRIDEKIDKKISDRWLTTREVCNYTGLSNQTVFRAIRKGNLKVSQGTGKNLFRRSWVDRWVEGR